MIALAVALFALLAGYELLVRWQMARTPALRYNAVVARVLRLLLPSSMICLSLWHTGWLLYPANHPRMKLVDWAKLMLHEIDGHMKLQWDRWPRTFPFRYLWELARKGYNANRFENEARRVAGEPERT